MPTISMFYGIIISMFFEIREKHHLPHIHVRYQSHRASVAIDDGILLAGIAASATAYGASLG